MSTFLPPVATWFAQALGTPTRTQDLAWPAIAAGGHVLLAAPTGTGKTLAACLLALDRLWREGAALPDACRLLYISPLKALSTDVELNLLRPIEGVQALDPFLPRLRSAVRTGDTPAAERAAMARKRPHIVVTTPESLHLLLTSASGRRLLDGVATVVVDEIHAIAGSKRGSHLALCLERLDDLVTQAGHAPPQRIGLSATQKPLADIAALLAGTDRPCRIVDAGHLRTLDLAVETPGPAPETVCSHERWAAIYDRIAELSQQRRTTLVFTATRKLAERLAARLTERLGDGAVGCHHGSLSKERRQDAERRLKAGQLRVLCATASLELGIDIGEVDLVVQVGSPRAIATFLQRVGRAGHAVHRTPVGRVFPLTCDEAVEAAALLQAVGAGELDALRVPQAPRDLLAQQVVAACCDRPRSRDDLLTLVRGAWPFRGVDAAVLDATIALHTGTRHALLVDDAGTIRATARAKHLAGPNGGAIPDTAVFTCREEPGDAVVGTLDEDFSLESSPGEVIQLGNRSWRILRVESAAGVVRVTDAHGQPPTIPFWLGEAPGRTVELSAAVGRLRSGIGGDPLTGVDDAGREAIRSHLDQANAALGCLPSQELVVAERFFDETGGTQLVVHAPFGGRINRAWALALRKKFCTGFGFELEAAGGDEGFLLSLAPGTSFPLEEIFTYLSPATVRETIEQAVLTGGQFETRWRHNAARALLVERMRLGKRTPPHLLRLRAQDALAAACPSALACPDNLPAGPREVPREHPLVAQTLEDCCNELLDTDGLIAVLHAIRSGAIATRAVDTPEPSTLARGLVALGPYAFLDDVPFEERRVRAVAPVRHAPSAQVPGELDPAIAAQVRSEAWPQPASEDEVAEVLAWIGWVTAAECTAWAPWPERLVAASRAAWRGERLVAANASDDAVALWRGRLEAVGPVALPIDHPELLALEGEGVAMRCTIGGVHHWCHRRLLARIHARMRDARRSHDPLVDPAAFRRFLASWQGLAPGRQGTGVEGLRHSLRQLAGWELQPGSWNACLARRVERVDAKTIDALAADGTIAWGRLWNGASGRKPPALASTPIAIIPREETEAWIALAGPAHADLPGAARQLHALLVRRGALFPADCGRLLKLVPMQIEDAMADLFATGLATCDQPAGLRWLLLSAERRRRLPWPGGRLSLWRPMPLDAPANGQQELDLFQPQVSDDALAQEAHAEVLALALLRRWGVVLHAVTARERFRAPWRSVLRALRALELRGVVVGGRFVSGFSGEQYALPEAAARLPSFRSGDAVAVPEGDPLHLPDWPAPEKTIHSS